MKRSPLRRSSALSPGTKRLRRTQIKRVGKRAARERYAVRVFSARLGYERCEECNAGPTPDGWGGYLQTVRIEAHHLCSRARGAGHPLLHSSRNRAWLCAGCHRSAHEGRLPHLIKSRDFLDRLEQPAGPTEGPTDHKGLESGETPPPERPAGTLHNNPTL